MLISINLFIFPNEYVLFIFYVIASRDRAILFYFILFVFLGPHPQHVEVAGLGV